MNMKSIEYCITLILSAVVGSAAASEVLKSPDGTLSFTLEQQELSGVADYPSGMRLYYKIELDGREVMPFSPLGLSVKGKNLYSGLVLSGKSDVVKVDETFSLIQGKRAKVRDYCNEQTFTFENPKNKQLQIKVRVYDEGVAFRYILPGETRAEKSRILKELTGFRIPLDARAWLMPYDEAGVYKPAYEAYYTDADEVGKPSSTGLGWSLPALFSINDGDSWVLIHEAALDENYFGFHLNNNCAQGVYRVQMPEPDEGDGEGKVLPESVLPWVMPWRVVMVADSLGPIVESEMIKSLNPPSKISDTSWIKPGRASWEWWSIQAMDRDYALNIKYIDMAVELGWEYCLVDVNWNEMEGDRNIESLIQYANTKGIGILLWYNSGGLHNQVFNMSPRNRMLTSESRLKEFKKISSLGVKGIKVDFFNTDKQFIMAQYFGILRDAAKHELLVNFHGCTVPRGWSRTWPNLMTMEAVTGAECYAFSPGFPKQAPYQNTTIPFTRNVIGPVDYTPVALTDQRYVHQTSYGHELALSVVYQSGLIHFADGPAMYGAQPDYVREFISDVPAQFDDMKFLDGYPGRYVSLARRTGSTWYVGTISSLDKSKKINLSLDFLGEGKYELLEINDGSKPKTFTKKTSHVSANDNVKFVLQPKGGCVLVIKKVE